MCCMNSCLFSGRVVRSSRARRSGGEAVAGAGCTCAQALISSARPSRLTKSFEHSGWRVDDHWILRELRLPRAIAGTPIPGHFFISRRDETLCERIIEHVLYIPRPRTIVEEAKLVPYCALIHLSQLFACHKRSIFVFEGLPVSCRKTPQAPARQILLIWLSMPRTV